MKSIQKIVIIGSGNVAFHLAKAFSTINIDIVAIHSRNRLTGQELATNFGTIFYSSIQEIPLEADLYILAVKDDQIEVVANKLPKVKGIVVHTSGTKSTEYFAHLEHFGVFYPLQTMNKSVKVDFTKIPICIHSNKKSNNQLLEELALKLSPKVYFVNDEQRKKLHVAAVMVNNFTNHLYQTAEEYLTKNEIDFSILLPLIQETAEKVQQNPPQKVQTGPAKRGDQQTIKTHLELLEQEPELKSLYQLFTERIKKSK